MSVKIIRKKERLTSQWTELEVYMDGEKKTSIFGNDSTEVELEGEKGELKVKQIMNRAVTEPVKDGDTVEVSNAPLVKYLFYLMPVILLLMFASSYFNLLNFWILTAFVVVFIFVAVAAKPLQIKLLQGSDRENGNSGTVM